MVELWLALALLGIVAASASLYRSVGRLRALSARTSKVHIRTEVEYIARSIVRRRVVWLTALLPAAFSALSVEIGYLRFRPGVAVFSLILFEAIFVVNLVIDEIEDMVMNRRASGKK